MTVPLPYESFPCGGFLARAAEGFVDGDLPMRNQSIGRRFVIVQVVDHALVFVLAEAKAVIRQQLIVDHVLVRSNERQDRPDVLLVGIDVGDRRRSGDEIGCRETSRRPS